MESTASHRIFMGAYIHVKLLIFLLLLLASQEIARAASYYVSNAGNDNNSGRSADRPWARHPWMIDWKGTVELEPGDTVFMKRGDTWRISGISSPYLDVRQSGEAGRYITTTAYGKGNAPLIQITSNSNYPVIMIRDRSFLRFDNLHIMHWTSEFVSNGDNMNGITIYHTNTAPHDIIIENCEINNIPRICITGSSNSYNIVIGNKNAGKTATQTEYSNHLHDFGYAGVYLKGCNPVNLESRFEVCYNYIHDATRRNLKDNAYGIAFGANPASAGWPKYALARYNRVENINTWEGIECHGGSFIYFQDNYVRQFGAIGIWAGGTENVGSLPATSDNIYIERNIIEQPASGWVAGHEHAFILQYSESKLTTPSNIFIRDNICRYLSPPPASSFAGIRTSNVNGIRIEGNKVYNGNEGGQPAILIGTDVQSGCRNLIISRNYLSHWGPGININGPSISGQLLITNNIIRAYSIYCIVFSSSHVSRDASIRLNNNTLITSNNDKCISSAYGIASGGVVTANNNIIGWASPQGAYYYYWYWGGKIDGTFLCSNNLYWNGTSGTPFFTGGKAADWNSWTTISQNDRDGLGPDVNPVFMNSTGSFSSDNDFKLQSSSPAINAGKYIGSLVDYAGNPASGLPDIGAYEFIPKQPPPSPVYQKSAVRDAAPEVIIITYNLNLANIIPAVSAFTVRVNSAARAVNSVSVSEKQVLLTLASPIVYGDAVTVAYSKPSSNPLQSTEGGYAESFPDRTVTNDRSPPVPVYVSSVIQNSSPSLLELTYSLSLAGIVPSASAFTVTVNSAARSVNSVAISGTKVQLTLSGPVANGNTVSVAYSKPASSPIQTPAGGQAASFSAQTVKNNVAAVAVPVFAGASVENATPSQIGINYNLSLANIVPAASAFTVMVSSSQRTVSSVTVSGTKVLLTLSNAVSNGNAVTVAYAKPSANPLQTAAGGQAASFSAQTVKNNVAAVPVPVFTGASVENATPSQIGISYNLSLANIVPAASAFTVMVNSSQRTVSSVSVTGTTVRLTLQSPVLYGDKITFSYTLPSKNPLQTPAGGLAASLASQAVANRTEKKNTAPVINVVYEPAVYSGFISEIDAGPSADADNDILAWSWVAPQNIPVSSTSGSMIQFLSPVVDASQTVNFTVNVSDGKTTVSKTIPVEIHPYEPELSVAEVIKVEAGAFSPPNYPYNIADGNIATMWAANGDNQWLTLELKEPFSIHHVRLSFLQGQKSESFFDILGSEDMVTWEPVLIKSNSCNFSGSLQVFNFPPSKKSREYRYVKLVGHGNSTDSWNYISEIRILGYPAVRIPERTDQLYRVYPNPATDHITVSAVNTLPAPAADHIRIATLTGIIVIEEKIDPGLLEFSFPINLKNGIYIVQMIAKRAIIHSVKLVVGK